MLKNHYLSDNFKEKILYGKPKKAKPVEVEKVILTRPMLDSEIQSELGVQTFERDVFLATVEKLIEEDKLSKKWIGNIFHVKGKSRTLAVGVWWADSQWEFICLEFDEYGAWNEGCCAFSPAPLRPSVTSETSTETSLETAIKVVKEAGYKVYQEV